MQAHINALCNERAWSMWKPLQNCWKGSNVPNCPGLYRLQLRAEHTSQMAYIGQSGNLKKRVYALRHIYDEQMPYKAPHTVGPALWSWRQKVPEAVFDISLALFPDLPNTFWLGLESLAIALCRQRDFRSPLCQFGRMPEGYMSSSGNDARLALTGKRYHGGPTQERLECHYPGMAPQGPLEGDPHTRAWGGHHWTPWVPLGRFSPVRQAGLYRLRVPTLDPLIFVGQGKLVDRFKQIQPLDTMECSWISSSVWLPHQRLELVTDLVAAHLFTTATLPLWQFEPSHDEPDGAAPQRNVS